MSRPRLLVALTFTGLLAALAYSHTKLPSLADLPAVRPAPAVHAQAAEVPATNVTATLFDNVVDWQTLPSTQVTAQVRSNNMTRAAGQAMSGADGRVRINIGGGPGGGGGGGGANANIRPGDQIRLIPQGGVTATLTVPSFGADVDVDGDAVVGRAPAGGSVQVVLTHAGSPMTRTVTADAAGAFRLALAGQTDVSPGDTGVASLTTADGNTFRAEVAGLIATTSMGSRTFSGDATAGNVVRVGIRDSAGTAKGFRNTTVQGGGTDWAAGQGGGGGGPGGGAPFGPIAVGDTITMSVTSTLPGGTRQVEGVVPTISIQVDAATRTVRGVGPAGATVEIEALAPDGQIYRATASPNPGGGAGAFTASLGGAASIGPGWRISAIVGIAPGLRVRATDALEQITVGVHTNAVSGVADPGQTITATLKAADGTVKATRTTQSSNQAQFATSFNAGGGPGGGGGQAADIEVGDILEVEFISGDPIIITIPRVTAQTDAGANTVGGLAPAGSSVTVTQGGGGGPGGGQPLRTATATAGADGRYSADFTGQLDIVAPMNGNVTIRLPSGHQLTTAWAAVRMTLEIGDNYVTGNGPPGRQVEATLVDSNITVNVAAGDDETGGGGGGGGGFNNWQVQFEDTLGLPVNIRVADTVRAVVGDDTINLKVPELSGVAFVADDIINGKTTPNRALTLSVQRILAQGQPPQNVAVTADANGNFSHDFGDTFDLQHNDVILFQTQEQGHIIISRLLVPGLRLNLDEARLTGSWKPNTTLDVTLSGAGRPAVVVQARTGEDATFTTLIQSGGQRAEVRTGDTLKVKAQGSTEELTLVVPELTVAGDAGNDTVSGRATPGGVLQLTVSPTFPRAGGGFGPGGGGQTRNLRPTVNADGTWSTGFQPAYNVQPGTRMATLYREPTGHLVERIRFVPIANVQHGGGNVCGFAAAPRADVGAALSAAGGAAVGSASGRSDYDSSFGLVMNDRNGAPVRSEAGQTAKVTLSGQAADVVMPTLSVSVTWGQPLVSVTGPVSTTVYFLRPARYCLDVNRQFVFNGQTNGQGTLNANVGFGIDPGDGLEVALYTQGGHRIYRHVFRSLGQVYVGTERVGGRATPLSPVTVVLLSASGTERARATVVANADGVFDARFGSGANRTIIQPTDKVRLDASGETPEIQVEKLAFDWSRGDPITLDAAPSRLVVVTIALDGRPSITFGITTDESGKWKFEAADVPPRAGWELKDITGVRAVVETANGHQIIAETGETTGPTPTPTPPGKKIYLPATLKTHRFTGR